MKITPHFWLYLFWLTALMATAGSLFFSEVMYFIPCTLCWYQRIFMYPLVLIGIVGILKKDKSFFYFAMPLASFGTFFALYHNLVTYGIIAEELSPCSMGVPCSTHYIDWFGFITIPLLSLIAFLIILVSLYFFKKGSQ
ncbi:MAG: disulfide bond formation protein B [Sulfurospirillum sp.]|nr:disulfide bond formation protein B [Sulfurospirillum sp.]